MLDISVNMIVRNGEDYIRQCVETVIPFVKEMFVTIDSTSDDETRSILSNIRMFYNNLFVDEFDVADKQVDLVRMRNHQLKKINSKWGWIIDSDEYYPFEIIKKIELGDSDAYGFTSWAVWDETHAHRSTSKRPTMRIFRNNDNLKWVGTFGHEKLFSGDKDLCTNFDILPLKYIHLTHVKKDTWRKEMNQQRRVDGRFLSGLPENIISIYKKINETM